MKNLSKYIEEKLIINKDYAEPDYEDKEFHYTELPEYILKMFAIYNPSQDLEKLGVQTDKHIIKINKLSDEEYDVLYDELIQLFHTNNVKNVHIRNITFYGNPIAVAWLPDDIQKSYNKQNLKWPDDSHKLFATNNFYIWTYIKSEPKTIYVIYWRQLNNLVYYCKIYY